MYLPCPAALADLLHQRPQRGGADDGVLHQKHPLARKHRRQRRVLALGAPAADAFGLDKRPADVTVADKPLHAGDAHMIGEGIGGGFGRIGHRHDDTIRIYFLVFHLRQALPCSRTGPVHAHPVDLAGDVGEVDPFEEAPRPPFEGGEPLEPQPAVFDDGHLPGFERMDVGKTRICQRHRFAGRAEQPAMHRPVHRVEAQLVAGHEHPPHRIEEGDIVRAVEFAGEVPHNFLQIREILPAKAVGQRVHNDFRIGIEREVVAPLGKQPVAQGSVVGQRAVERQAEALPQPAVLPLERLGVADIVLAAGGIAGVPDGGAPGIVPHDRLIFPYVRHAEGFDNGAEVLERVDNLRPIRVVCADSSSKLAPVLQVQQHARHQRSHVFNGVLLALVSVSWRLIQPVQRRHTAFMADIVAHRPLRRCVTVGIYARLQQP